MKDTSYDEVPYFGSPFVQTHPDRLAVMALLFGMRPAAVDRCRVLELGCTDGGNLIPMAFTLPESRFVGVDLAASAIASGNRTVQALGLTNIELHAADLTEISPEWGTFDFIIAHGLYSWVPRAVREHILRVCQENLAPHGVAFISYNAYPGCHLRNLVREMMLFHVREVNDPVERVQQARALIQALADGAPSRTDGYQLFLQAEAQNILDRDPNVLFHDELSDTWQPFYLHEFLEQAARHDLKFLSEANLSDMQDPGAASSALLDQTSDRVTRDQYRDFLKCRKFRQTLLCHGEVELSETPRTEIFQGTYMDSGAKLVFDEAGVKEYTGPPGAALRTAHPLAIRLLDGLIAAWPGAISFAELTAELQAEERMAATDILFAAFRAGLVQPHTFLPGMATAAGDRPLVNALARYQASEGAALTTLRHTLVAPASAIEQKLVTLLDGTRGRDALQAELHALRPEIDRPAFAAELETNLRRLAAMGLLAG